VDWALASGVRAESFGTATGTPGAVTVTSSATANTKGSWTQLDAATGFEATSLVLTVNTQFGDTQYLLDIGVGGAGSEQVLIPNLHFAYANGTVAVLTFPISVPAGSRISARVADNFGGSIIYVSGVVLVGGFVDPPPFQSVVTYGADTTKSAGTLVDSGATVDTKGSWTQITASTTSSHKGLMVSMSRPDMGVAMTAAYAQLADIGVGGSGSEQVLIPNVRAYASPQTGGASGSPLVLTNRGVLLPSHSPFVACDIPAGSRIAIRQESSTTNAADRTCHYLVHCLI
jgi:hypothetical protein